MKDKVKFRYAEKCLYDYRTNLSRIEVLSEDLRVLRSGGDVHGLSYQMTFNFGADASDPVLEHVAKIQKLENQIKNLERVTRPITKLIHDLSTAKQGSINQELMKILELFYVGGMLLSDVMDELHRSRRTLSSRRYELVIKTIRYLGL